MKSAEAIVADSEQSARDPRLACPSCGSEKGVPFYDSQQVPAHSSLLMSSFENALDYPRGDIRLSFCADCGFITNLDCDLSLQAYSPQHEESQHFSSFFSTFAEALAQRWIDQFDIRGKTILEIGCGKGDFLDLFCKLGDNRGIGIDPGCIPERLSAEASTRIELIQDYYSEKYSHLDADVICCRHTLEHILPTGQFIEMIRRTIGTRHDTLVVFELPDVTRVLRERAFWDIYYEHCSYFTAGSLGRLFRRQRFDVIDLRREYDEQYLTLVARPTEQPTASRFELEEDLEQTADDVRSFQAACPANVQDWRDRLGQLARDGRKVIAWGSGSKCVSFCTTLGVTNELAYVVDINPYKHDKFLPGTGHRIVGPDFLLEDRPDVIVVMNPIYCDEIQRDLDTLGVSAELLPV